MRGEDLSGTIFYMKQTFFFMRWKQGSCSIYDKIYLHHRLMLCILSKSVGPKLIWGYYLDRFSPDKTTVLSQQLKARKHTINFFLIYSLFFGFIHSCLLISDLHHNWRTVLDSSSSLLQLHNWHGSSLLNPSKIKIKVYLKHWSKQFSISTNQSQKIFLYDFIHHFFSRQLCKDHFWVLDGQTMWLCDATCKE